MKKYIVLILLISILMMFLQSCSFEKKDETGNIHVSSPEVDEKGTESDVKTNQAEESKNPSGIDRETIESHSLEHYKKLIKKTYLRGDFVYYDSISFMGEFNFWRNIGDRWLNGYDYFFDGQEDRIYINSLVIWHDCTELPEEILLEEKITLENIGEDLFKISEEKKGIFDYNGIIYRYNMKGIIRDIHFIVNDIYFEINFNNLTHEDYSDYVNGNCSEFVKKILSEEDALDAIADMTKSIKEDDTPIDIEKENCKHDWTLRVAVDGAFCGEPNADGYFSCKKCGIIIYLPNEFDEYDHAYVEDGFCIYCGIEKTATEEDE